METAKQVVESTHFQKRPKRFNVKLSFKKTHYSEYEEWLSLYPTVDKLCFKLNIGSYFDERIQINSHVTTIIAIIGFIIQPWLSLWFLPLWILCLVIPYGHFFLKLPIYTNICEAEHPSYGFYLYAEGRMMFDSFWLCTGEKVKSYRMPWEWDWYRSSILLKDGTWEHEYYNQERKSFYLDKWDSLVWKEDYPYTYVLKSGTVQERIATVKVEEREWRWRGFKRFSFPSKIRKCIDVKFNDEVGEGTGSWKGGTVGCGYEMFHGELPIHTLRRMEKERKFGR